MPRPARRDQHTARQVLLAAALVGLVAAIGAVWWITRDSADGAPTQTARLPRGEAVVPVREIPAGSEPARLQRRAEPTVQGADGAPSALADARGPGLQDEPEMNEDARVAYEAGLSAHERGDYEEALAAFSQALELDPENLLILSAAGRAAKELGDYAAAASLLERALVAGEALYGYDQPGVAATLDELGVVYTAQERYEEAKVTLERALLIKERHFGPDHLGVATVLNHLANMYVAQGSPEFALPLLERALAIDERHYGRNHPGMADQLSNLGWLYHHQGRYADAEEFHQRALAIHEASLGSEHPRVAAGLRALASLYLVEGRIEDAEPLLERAIAIQPDALALAKLGQLSMARGQHVQAAKRFEDAIIVQSASVGLDHPSMWGPHYSAGVAYKAQRRWAEAAEHHARALDLANKWFGPEHSKTVRSREHWEQASAKVPQPNGG